LAKNGSFGFAKGRLVCRAKPNVPFVRLAKIVFKKCVVGKKIKHEALGCRVGKKSAVKFICRPVVSIIVVSLMVVVSSVTLAYNGLQIGDGRAFQHKSLFGVPNFLLPQNCQTETKPRLLPMCCYGLVLSITEPVFSHSYFLINLFLNNLPESNFEIIR
jgi:hypothetical protein